MLSLYSLTAPLMDYAKLWSIINNIMLSQIDDSGGVGGSFSVPNFGLLNCNMCITSHSNVGYFT